MKPTTQMTVEEMDAWAAKVYGVYATTGQEAEARAFYRCGEYIRELGKRIGILEDKHLNGAATQWVDWVSELQDRIKELEGAR